MDGKMIQAIIQSLENTEHIDNHQHPTNTQDSQNHRINAILATIISTQGSVPRDLGTQMLVFSTGRTTGTIGGGTAEKRVRKRALTLLAAVPADADKEDKTEDMTGKNQGEIYSLTLNQESDPTRLPVCGANIDVLLEPVQNLDFWQLAQNLQMREKKAVLITSLSPPYAKYILDPEGHVLGGPPQLNLNTFPPVQALARITSHRQAEVIGLGDEAGWFAEPLLTAERLLILGAGHVAREVAYYASRLDFQITVIDDRADFALPEFFPPSCSVICRDFAAGIREYQPDQDTYAVIATWSHQKDADCAAEILSFTTKYAGMLGSSKKLTPILHDLSQRGYSPERLAHLRSPVGLPIGGQTPAEIAVSILAEIISVRRAP